jgi:hypothetical protein
MTPDQAFSAEELERKYGKEAEVVRNAFVWARFLADETARGQINEDGTEVYLFGQWYVMKLAAVFVEVKLRNESDVPGRGKDWLKQKRIEAGLSWGTRDYVYR